MKKSNLWMKALGVFSSALLCFYTIVPAGYASDVGSTSNTNNSSSSETNSKDETVYVFADSSGATKNIIVSDWLKNPSKQAQLSDSSNLSNITNVEGDEGYTTATDGAMSWSASGNDIYYQGDSTDKAPITISVTYTLDGKTVSPSEIANKSGKVKVRFDYTNNSSETIDGNTIYTPFAVVSGIVLNNDHFSNVSVSNGKLINDGDRTIVAGFAFPGLQSSLGVGSDVVDIPSYVEITADASDFQMDATATVATASLFNDVDTSSFDTSSLTDSLGQLTSAMNQLIDGSSALYDGIAQLAEGSQELAAGTGTLESSTSSMPEQTGELASAAQQVNNGLYTMRNGSSTSYGLVDAVSAVGTSSDTTASSLYGGTNIIKGGLVQLRGNATDTQGSLYAAYNGASSVSAGLGSAVGALSSSGSTTPVTIRDSISSTQSALSAADQYLGGTGTLSSTQSVQEALQSAQSVVPEANSDISVASDALDASSLENASSKLASASSQVDAVNSDLDGIDTSGAQDAKNTLDGIDTTGMTDAQKEAIRSASNSLSSSSDNASAVKKARSDASAASDTVSSVQSSVDDAASTVKSTKSSLEASESALSSDVETLGAIDPQAVDPTAAKTYVETAMKLNSATAAGIDNTLKPGLVNAKGGTDAIASGLSPQTGAIAGVNTLIGGVSTLQGGLSQLLDGTSTPVNGKTNTGLNGAIAALGTSSTSGTLIYGSNAIANGTETLAEAAPSLVSGIQALNTGAQQLSSGTSSAQEGSMQLSEGLQEFNNEGIQKLVDVLGGDLGTATSRLKSIVQAGKDYTTFSGKSADMDGNVKFVYETDSIGK